MAPKDARTRGEAEQRLYALSVWRETPSFTERERAALARAEAVTEVARSRVPDDVYHTVRQHLGEKELVDLTLAVVVINGWNRSGDRLPRASGHLSAPRGRAPTGRRGWCLGSIRPMSRAK